MMRSIRGLFSLSFPVSLFRLVARCVGDESQVKGNREGTPVMLEPALRDKFAGWRPRPCGIRSGQPTIGRESATKHTRRTHAVC
jgi:hypothetical protein